VLYRSDEKNIVYSFRIQQWRNQEFSSNGQKLLEAQNFSGQSLGKASFLKDSAGKNRSSKILSGQMPICPPPLVAPLGSSDARRSVNVRPADEN
jgi:hypothetical protein